MCREYARGRTPNPCVRCNAAIKFGRLWERLRNDGFTHLATGHYARRNLDDDRAPALFRGVDRRKDQSYFLSRLPLSLLPNLLFPLGQMTKEEVRRLARQAGLPVQASQPESMELCFIPAGQLSGFPQGPAGHRRPSRRFRGRPGASFGPAPRPGTLYRGPAPGPGGPRPGALLRHRPPTAKPTGWCWDTGMNSSPRGSRPPG